ncbi:hypothetical protein [Synechococcus sp. ROS8604]|uniref:hypothetical protein n=1 Tax=Synechococcus sp. ROS8604 TaxID=1442557 RepID=UPI0016440F4B|nr:hypothetical protein [Synechococcus sp. ROS8604]QNI88483.1 hypothetical protein SynROS8604_01852 [Synechococcus sp. ROS8604]
MFDLAPVQAKLLTEPVRYAVHSPSAFPGDAGAVPPVAQWTYRIIQRDEAANFEL